MKNEFIDWQRLIRTAFYMGIMPQELWKLTPWEFTAIVGSVAPQTISREDFEKLQQQFPDR